jgi:ABC-type glutathione transport system ATPase component
MSASDPILAVQGLRVELRLRTSPPRPLVDGVSFEASAGRVLGLVGESGSGKTMTVRAILGVAPYGTTVHGRVDYRGQAFDGATTKGRQLLGREICSVFQDARSSLHPTFSIGRQLDWALKRGGIDRRSARQSAARELLERVGLAGTQHQLQAYPYEFSGGMCQRVALAIALAPGPSLLFADEPTSALDPTIQLQIADLFAEVARERDLALILITHDIRLVSYVADDVAVMYRGCIVEAGTAASVLASAKHDYTRLLLEATV